MNIIKLYDDYNIPYDTEGNNVGPGWVNVQCCWCDDRSNHLGYNLQHNFFRCWRCGGHGPIDTIKKLTGMSAAQTKIVIQKYGGLTGRTAVEEPEPEVKMKAFKPPSGTGPLTPQHKRYLEKRGFDAERVGIEWGLASTGPMSELDGIDYRHRIIAPIYWEEDMVSFQGRDVTGKAKLRYRTCPKDRELIHHKNILYRHREAEGDFGICCEGITDVWRFGPSAFATFGINYTTTQVRVISKLYKHVVIAFDNETEAQKQAKKLEGDLKIAGVKVWRVDLPSDPGSLSQREAGIWLTVFCDWGRGEYTR